MKAAYGRPSFFGDLCRAFASVPNPKFAPLAAPTFANFGFERTLEIYDFSVVLVQNFSAADDENF